MLAANEAVAEKLAEAGMRRALPHPRAARSRAGRGVRRAGGVVRLPRARRSSRRCRPEDFQLILRQIEGKPEEKLISYLLLRTMKLARYHEENLGHFGLATEMYAHFTSPIRRYPDLVVHRALRALRHGRGARAPAALPERAARDGPAPLGDGAPGDRCRARADRVEEGPLHGGQARRGLPGYVTGVQAFGLFVELDEIYVQGLVHVSSMSDDYYQFDERAHLLKGENTRQGLPPGRPGRGPGGAGGPGAAADRLRAGRTCLRAVAGGAGRERRARPRRGGRLEAPRRSAARAQARARTGPQGRRPPGPGEEPRRPTRPRPALRIVRSTARAALLRSRRSPEVRSASLIPPVQRDPCSSREEGRANVRRPQRGPQPDRARS